MIKAAEIESHLRQYVVGQEDAVRTVAVAAAQHYARAAYSGDTPLKKANVLIVGPTGVGKTQMVRALAELLDVPFVSISAPAITQPGFTGLDPDTGLQMLLQKAGKGNREKAERGIIYLDEIDKIAKKETDEGDKSKNLTTGLGVQQALLEVLDAGLWTFPNGQQMDARHVLFIMSGAFVGIEHIVSRRMNVRSAGRPRPYSIGEALRMLEPQDLIAYGLIPEFVGRCPVIATLRPLDPHEILRILTEPLDAPVRRLQAEFEALGATLTFDAQWLHQVAVAASQHPLGARSLEGEIRGRLRDVFYAARDGDLLHVRADGSVEKRAPATPTSPDGAEPAARTPESVAG